MPLTSGARLGPYEIVSALGAGGMGEVYRARFEREAKLISSLNHPHICTLFDVGREGETDYLVMELVEGITLAERLKRGPLTSAELLRFGGQIADAIDRAHRAGVIHRDLKPANVMLAKNGAKLMDFGLSRVAAGPAGPATTTYLRGLDQVEAHPISGSKGLLPSRWRPRSRRWSAVGRSTANWYLAPR